MLKAWYCLSKNKNNEDLFRAAYGLKGKKFGEIGLHLQTVMYGGISEVDKKTGLPYIRSFLHYLEKKSQVTFLLHT